MSYSQKYTIVQFLEPTEEQQSFSMDSWPLHLTLADVFAVDLDDQIVGQLGDLIASENSITVEAGTEDTLGDAKNPIKVTLIQNTTELQSLHNLITSFLENNGAEFNSPQFTHGGFLPHVSVQGKKKLTPGEELNIKRLSLIDMFVDGDWQQRKVLANFMLGE